MVDWFFKKQRQFNRERLIFTTNGTGTIEYMQTKRTLIYALYYMLILVQNEVHTYLNVKPKTKSSFKKKEKKKIFMAYG